jgi:hypothetical protein
MLLTAPEVVDLVAFLERQQEWPGNAFSAIQMSASL